MIYCYLLLNIHYLSAQHLLLFVAYLFHLCYLLFNEHYTGKFYFHYLKCEFVVTMCHEYEYFYISTCHLFLANNVMLSQQQWGIGFW